MLSLQSCRAAWDYMTTVDHTETGLENIDKYSGDFEVDQYLLPDHNFSLNIDYVSPQRFIDDFNYVDGNYWSHVCDSLIPYKHQERVLAYMQYEDDVYIDAKTYAMENLILSEEPIDEYNGYVFYFNDTAREKDHLLRSTNYPYSFLAFSHNDDKNTLVFFGMYAHGESVEEIKTAADDFLTFLEKYYGEWYSFS
jgi:hypothetical protein